MRFKRQTARSTRMDSTENINVLIEHMGLEIGILSRPYWGDFKSRREPKDTLIEVCIAGTPYRFTPNEFINLIKEGH